MASPSQTSLSAAGPRPTNTPDKSTKGYSGVSRPPHLSQLERNVRKLSKVETLSIPVDDPGHDAVPAFLHLPPSFDTTTPRSTDGPDIENKTARRTAAILVSGAGGGVSGPSSMFLSIACKMSILGAGVPILRLDYRFPAQPVLCVADVRAAMAYLQKKYALDRFILVGWSFGGAPVFTVGGEDTRVVACATVASQMAEAEGIRRLAPRPVLLLHGTEDKTLSAACSSQLYSMYGDEGDRTIRLFEGGNHALTSHASEAEGMLCEFIARGAELQVDEKTKTAVLPQELVQDGEREFFMKRGGDLKPPESIE